MKRFCTYILLIMIVLLVSVKQISALDCSKTLRVGSKGSNVSELQRALNSKMNCGLSVDGDFGNLTKACVIKYQTKYGLDVDGIVGPQTCGSLNKTTSSAITTYSDTSTTYVVVTVSYANIRSRATTSSSIVGSTTLGSILTVVGTSSNWYKIKIPNSSSYGYIRNDLVAKNSVVVDISEQKLYFYKNGQKSWSTNVVTGNKGNHDTPIGSYTMYSSNFDYNTYLSGTNDNGTKYRSFVNYWMPFITSRGIGFHDATWRPISDFNSSTYKTNGSHACVNMQLEAAKKLYNSVSGSIKVVVRN